MAYVQNNEFVLQTSGMENHQYDGRQFYGIQQHAGLHPYAHYKPQTVAVQPAATEGGLIENRERPGRLRRILHKAHSTKLGFRSQEYARY